VTVYHLGEDINRETFGLGGIITPRKNHEGTIKRPTETSAEWRVNPRERLHLSDAQKIRIKRGLAQTLIELNRTESHEKVRSRALELRKEAGKYLSPEETGNVYATVAIALCLKNSGMDVSFPTEEEGDLVIKQGDISRSFVVKTTENHEVSITPSRNTFEPEKLTVGDELFSTTTGQPYTNLERKLMEIL